MLEHVAASSMGGCDVLSAQAAGFHSFDKFVVLDEHCGESSVFARTVRVLGSTYRSSGEGLWQSVVVAGAGGVYTLSCGA